MGVFVSGCLCQGDLPDRDPRDRDPLDRDPPDQNPLDRDPPGRNMGPGTDTPPPEGTWDQAARQEVTSYRNPPPTPVDRMTDKRL